MNTLLLVVRIKAMCKRAQISKFDGGPKGATIQFYNSKFKSPSGLVTFIDNEMVMQKFVITNWWLFKVGQKIVIEL